MYVARFQRGVTRPFRVKQMITNAIVVVKIFADIQGVKRQIETDELLLKETG